MPNTVLTTRRIASVDDIEPGVLTVPEVARELRCSKAHVFNLIRGTVHGARQLPALWLGRRRLVRRSSLEEWIKENEHGAML
jgi:excisionase family DNA binding protein